jgi:magnesium transporter
VYEALEEAKETVEIYKDMDYMLSQEKTNKILAVLTIVFTLCIPATVIGTFYGMNINLPGGIETGIGLS